MANLKSELEKVELYRAYSVEEIQERRDLFSKITYCGELMSLFLD